MGCSGSRAVAPTVVSSAGASELLSRARELTARGESHRAEQYYLAALDAGAPPGDIYPELIDVCVRGGRLGRASVHVDARMRQNPQDFRLVRLAISLREALGHSKEAAELAEQLASSEKRGEEEDLFLAGYFERSQDVARALSHYHFYLERTKEASRPAWVDSAVRRLELHQSQEDTLALHEVGGGKIP